MFKFVEILSNIKYRLVYRAPSAKSWIDDVFGGILTFCTQCACGNQSFSHDPCLDLQLEIVPAQSKGLKGKDSFNLFSQCLAHYFRPDSIEGRFFFFFFSFPFSVLVSQFNFWFPIADFSCSECKKKSEAQRQIFLTKKSEAQRQIFLTKTPPVLVVQLKRFYFDGDANASVKLPHFVKFPSQFDLADYVMTNQLDDVRINLILFLCKFHDLIHLFAFMAFRKICSISMQSSFTKALN